MNLKIFVQNDKKYSLKISNGLKYINTSSMLTIFPNPLECQALRLFFKNNWDRKETRKSTGRDQEVTG